MTGDPAVGRGIALVRGPGRAAALALVAAALVLRIIDPGIITELRVRSFDLVERVWPRAADSARVAVVDIDEKSLAQYGQWPWPRHLVAELVRRIAQGNPRVLGIEILFAERDRLSPTEIARELPDLPAALADALAKLPPSDRDLAEAIAAVPTVLSLAPSHEEVAQDSGLLRPAPIREAGDDPTPFLKSYKSLVQSQPDLQRRGVGRRGNRGRAGFRRRRPAARSRCDLSTNDRPEFRTRGRACRRRRTRDRDRYGRARDRKLQDRQHHHSDGPARPGDPPLRAVAGAVHLGLRRARSGV